MAVTADKPVPYAPTSAILEVIDRYRNRGLPSLITAEVLGRSGITDSLIPRVLQTLRTLDLIDEEGKASATLDGLRLAAETDYQKRLEAWLKTAYADVFSFVDPTKDGDTRIRDAFRSYQPAAQQARMVSLFTGLCAAAGLISEKPASERPSRPATPRPRTPMATSASSRAHNSVPASKTAFANAYGLPPAIAGLVESLPSPETGWTAAERDKFLTTFKAVLDFAIPVVTKKAPIKEADEEAA
jgi:Family of unknown function (DUF5343)